MTISKMIWLMMSMMGGATLALAEDAQPVVVQSEQTLQEVVAMPPLESPRLEIEETKIFSGKLIAADWQKSGESYCQGGGKYYVLAVKDQRYTLESLRDPIYEQDQTAFEASQQRLEKWVGRTVSIKGQAVVRYVSQAEHCPNPAMQCITGDITCRWIRVLKIMKKPQK